MGMFQLRAYPNQEPEDPEVFYWLAWVKLEERSREGPTNGRGRVG